MKKLLRLLLTMSMLTMLIAGLTACGSTTDGTASAATTNSQSDDRSSNTTATSQTTDNSSAADSNSDNITAKNGLLAGLHHAEIEVADYGIIYLELDADTAPITVTNFVNLANSGFYDNLTFMRVMANFMIQGGDPNKDCTGGAPTTIKGEFAANGVENNISHKRGTISMARANNMNSASSQFFICNADSEFLDGAYAAFGTVTDGMDVVDAITADFADKTDSNGVITDKNIQPIITTIKIID